MKPENGKANVNITLYEPFIYLEGMLSFVKYGIIIHCKIL